MIQALQFMDTTKSEQDAKEQFACLQGQDGYLSGRILSPDSVCKSWRVQVFFKLEDTWEQAQEYARLGAYPDGIRPVMIPQGFMKERG